MGWKVQCGLKNRRGQEATVLPVLWLLTNLQVTQSEGTEASWECMGPLCDRSPEGSWRGQEKEAPTCNHRNQSEVSGDGVAEGRVRE